MESIPSSDKYTLISLLLIQITVARDLVYCPQGRLNFWFSSSCVEPHLIYHRSFPQESYWVAERGEPVPSMKEKLENSSEIGTVVPPPGLNIFGRCQKRRPSNSPDTRNLRYATNRKLCQESEKIIQARLNTRNKSPLTTDCTKVTNEL